MPFVTFDTAEYLFWTEDENAEPLAEALQEHNVFVSVFHTCVAMPSSDHSLQTLRFELDTRKVQLCHFKCALKVVVAWWSED